MRDCTRTLNFLRMTLDGLNFIAMFLVTSPIVINVPTRGLLAVETMHAIVRWLATLNIKRNMTSMFVNKKHRYSRGFYGYHAGHLLCSRVRTLY